MKTKTFITIFALTLPLAAGAGLGDILASWETPRPSSNFNGIACEGEYIWVKDKLSNFGRVFRCTTTGSVVDEISLIGSRCGPFAPAMPTRCNC